MAHESKIEWTEATWNPWHGCHKVSTGCKNCYMFRDKKHYGQDPNVVVRSKTKFYDPLKWPEPRKIFTCSWSDFFIEEADPWRDEAFAIMALTPQHTYQVLTKRPERMLEYLNYYSSGRDHNRADYVADAAAEILGRPGAKGNDRYDAGNSPGWPLPNVWIGVSVEDQKTADERIPVLLQTPAAVRWLSVEPLLGPVDLFSWLPDEWSGGARTDAPYGDTPPVDWVVVGGESGPDARPMHPDWARSIRDQCTAANVPFFFKQWGEYAPDSDIGSSTIDFAGRFQPLFPSKKDECTEPRAAMRKVGKHNAGRTLDGRTWDEIPEV